MTVSTESWVTQMDNHERGKQVQEEMLQAIIGYIEEHGYPPSYREIGDMAGIKSTATVQHHMNLLLKEGKIETDGGLGAPRAFRIPGYKFVKVAG